MSVLFVVDHIFVNTSAGDVYTVGGKFPYSAWSTYLDQFDRLVVVARGKLEETVSGLARADGADVDFRLLAAKRGINRLIVAAENEQRIRELVEASDAVICRLPCESGLTALKYARRMRKPYLVELVACPWDALWNHGSPVAKIYAPIFTHRNRQAVLHAPLVRYVSHNFLQARYPTRGKTFVASNVLLELSDSIVNYESFTGTKRIVFGTIGALHTKLKGIDVALRALSELIRTQPGLEIEYRILGEGDGAWLQEVAARLSPSVHLVLDGSRMPGKGVTDWLDNIHVYLQPSYQEGLPRALIEAMGRSLICAGSTAGGIPELLPTSRMHHPGDHMSLMNTISEIISLPASAMVEESGRNRAIAAKYEINIMREARINSLVELKKQVP